eukprot:3176268-Rhodomonas_salina.3
MPWYDAPSGCVIAKLSVDMSSDLHSRRHPRTAPRFPSQRPASPRTQCSWPVQLGGFRVQKKEHNTRNSNLETRNPEFQVVNSGP